MRLAPAVLGIKSARSHPHTLQYYVFRAWSLSLKLPDYFKLKAPSPLPTLHQTRLINGSLQICPQPSVGWRERAVQR